MSDTRTLKQRLHAKEGIHIAFVTLNMSETELADRLSKDRYDLVHVDAQHTPMTDDKLVQFCQMAQKLGVPPQMRIRHTREAYLIGRFLDFGLFSVVVPQVEREETVDEAIEAFYYPPIGKRSWWPQFAYGHDRSCERREYADWWNANGVLVLQLESVAAILNVRKLAKPGVDLLAFGAADLGLSIEAHPKSPFASFEECHAFVVDQCKDLEIKVGASTSQVGQM
jgi:2-keto-3-deoxy-L-rhamnonate aldolase RhmA